jgi:hypothetical protein
MSTGYVAEGSVWDDERIPTRDGDESVEAIVVVSSDGGLRPYSGTDWGSGLVRLPITKFANGILGDEDRRGLVDGYPGAYQLVFNLAADGGLVHDGSVIKPSILGPRFGLEWG